MARVLVGTSGWSYASWRGPFFPTGLPAQRQLEYYASQASQLRRSAGKLRASRFDRRRPGGQLMQLKRLLRRSPAVAHGLG
jgi:hypothetical protein